MFYPFNARNESTALVCPAKVSLVSGSDVWSRVRRHLTGGQVSDERDVIRPGSLEQAWLGGVTASNLLVR